MSASAAWRARLWRRRWWLGAVALLVAVRMALPIVLRRVIESRASETLRARVSVGDVDLRLWRGGVALEDVAVRATDAPAPPPDAPADTAVGSAAPAFSDYSPIIAFKRFAVELRYLPLLHKTIQLRTVDLESPRLALDHLGKGELNVMALVPKTEVAVETGVTPGGDASPAPSAPATAEGITPEEAASPPPSVEASAGAGSTATTQDASPTPSPTPTVEPIATAGGGQSPLPSAAASVEAAATPGGDATPTPTGAPSGEGEGGGWSFGLDRFVLLDGRLRFRDLAIEGSEPVEVGIDEVHVDEIALAPEVYGAPARIHLKLGVDEGAIDVNARLTLANGGVSVATDVDANRLPLRRARLYIPNVGWSDLRGELDLALNYELEPKAKNAISGTLALRDVAVSVPNLEGVAISWRSLAATIDTIDLLGSRAAIADVGLDGALVTVRAQGGAPLPWLAGAGSPAPAGSPEPTPSPSAANAPPAKPLEWSVAKAKITDSKLHVLSDRPPLEVGVALDATGLAGAADAVGHAALSLALDPGSVALEGDLRIAELAFGGTLRIADLSLPPLVALSGALPPEAVSSAKLRADLAIAAGLPAGGGEAPADQLLLKGTIGLADVIAAPPAAQPVAVEADDVELAIDRAAVPGVIPLGVVAAPEAILGLVATLSLREPRVGIGGDQPIDLSAQGLVLKVPSLDLPAVLAALAPASGVPVVRGTLGLALDGARVALPDDTTIEAERATLDLDGVQLPVAAAGAPATGGPPAMLGVKLDLQAPAIATSGGKELNAGADSIALALTDLVVPGFVAGAVPPSASEPIRAAATLSMAKPRVVRGDGKEFSIAVASLSVPLKEVALPESLVFASGPAGSPIHAVFGEVSVQEPVIVVTRTKEGIVLPGGGAPAAGSSARAASPPDGAPAAAVPAAAPPPEAPAAAPQVDVQIASLRVRRGRLSFTDRAVDPSFATRVAPIEIDARNIRYPGPVVEPFEIVVHTEPEGDIKVTGKLSPDAGSVDLSIKQLALAPFNSYATAYSPYAIGDGALSLTLKATSKEGNYDVRNDLTLHDLELSGGEDESGFEKQFGIPLSLALALLRDTHGDIGLGIPLKVDRQSGASVDVARVVRSALRQAIRGAIQSPLKMLGAVGGGKKKLSMAPAPIAFRRGRAQPTTAGQKSIDRLGDFIVGRPSLGVQLSSAPTASDAVWLHEQELSAKWEDENFFRRALGFVTARGPRERIGDYLKARAKDKKTSLSEEDKATLAEWLAEIPPPTTEQLRSLAAERLAAVKSRLAKRGIDESRIALAEPSGEAGDGKPVAMFHLRAADEGTEPRPDAPQAQP